MVQLTDELLVELDELAERRRISRSALIREVLAQHLEDLRSADIGQMIVEGYLRVPPSTPDEWGDPVEISATSALEVLQRLDQEEKDAGASPW